MQRESERNTAGGGGMSGRLPRAGCAAAAGTTGDGRLPRGISIYPPYIPLYLAISRYISLYLAISRYISLYPA